MKDIRALLAQEAPLVFDGATGTYFAAALCAVLCVPLTWWVMKDVEGASWIGILVSIFCGLAAGCAIGYVTEYYTSDTYKPTQNLSDATETVLAGASAVRSTVGVAGLLAIFAIAAAPFFKIGLQYFLLKLTAALCGVVGQENHTALTESFAQAMGLLLAATGTCCLMQLLSTVCFMKGVI